MCRVFTEMCRELPEMRRGFTEVCFLLPEMSVQLPEVCKILPEVAPALSKSRMNFRKFAAFFRKLLRNFRKFFAHFRKSVAHLRKKTETPLSFSANRGEFLLNGCEILELAGAQGTGMIPSPSRFAGHPDIHRTGSRWLISSNYSIYAFLFLPLSINRLK